MKSGLGKFLAGVLPLMVIAASAALLVVHGALRGERRLDKDATTPPSGPPAHAVVTTRTRYIGLYQPGVPASWRPVAHFAHVTGVHPKLALYYSGWWTPFETRFAGLAHAAGAIPAIQMMPLGGTPTNPVTVGKVAAGLYDGYLDRFASAVRAYGHPVVISFAPEPNGHWYPWGWTRIPPHYWRAAWRHVVRLFRSQGADNVTWLLTLNRLGTANKKHVATGPFRYYWPGSRYVSWVGLDGYFELPTDTFRGVFGPSIRQVRQLTKKPLIISETAVGPVTSERPTLIRRLFAGLTAYRLIGVIWFDKSQHGDIYHQNWSIEGIQSAEAAFRQGARSFLRS
jgi:mannan endo-1,4-beta-mannosidase